MKATTVKKQNVARELTKGYIRLLTQAANVAKVVDDYFIGEDDSEVRMWFYGSMTFGIVVSLIILRAVV